MSRPIIALDVGGSAIKSGIVSLNPPAIHTAIHNSRQTPIDSDGNADQIIGTLHAIIADQRALADPSAPIGIAFPGPFDYQTGVCHIQGLAKYAALYGLNITAALKNYPDLRDVKIRYRNDAEAAVVGEAQFGAGHGYSRVIGLTLGTGCGSAFLIAGVPITSSTSVPPNGWLYPMLYQGVRADDLFSIRGLSARLAIIATSSGNNAADANRARAGDRALRAAFETFGMDLGAFLLDFVAGFQADAVLILGGIANLFDLFGDALQVQLPVPALTGQLGSAAPLYGAAQLFAK